MKIIFTSCTRYEAFKKQPEWNRISDENPDYLLLLGDNIYMDYGLKFLSKEPIGAPKKYDDKTFETIMNKKYENQFNRVPEFKSLVEKMRIKQGFYAVWDDHDFAWNNAKGATMLKGKKSISRKLFHKYLNCSTNYPHTYYHVDTKLARLIFIDNRTDAEKKGKKSRLLSKTQLEFIKSKLKHELKYTVLCGGLTLTEGHENWANYPYQLQELCTMLKTATNVIFLGGDIHKNKFVKSKEVSKTGLTSPIQLISSGMQVNSIGLRIPWFNQHNWAMLELEETHSKVSFYNKQGLQKRKSEKATKYMQLYFGKKDSF